MVTLFYIYYTRRFPSVVIQLLDVEIHTVCSKYIKKYPNVCSHSFYSMFGTLLSLLPRNTHLGLFKYVSVYYLLFNHTVDEAP